MPGGKSPKRKGDNCRVCGVELNDINWYVSCSKKNDRICKDCLKSKVKNYKKSNYKPKIREVDSSLSWCKIPGFVDYEVSEYGHVRRFNKSLTRPDGYILKGNKDASGYIRYKLSVNGKKITMKAHRLVCMAFHGPAPANKREVAHWDGNGLNNHYSNLRWATRRENSWDMARHGSLKGVNNGRAILNAQQVMDARREYQEQKGRWGVVAELARKYSVSHSAMLEAINGVHWGWVDAREST